MIVTWDPAVANFWLIADYFPAIAEIDRGRSVRRSTVFRATLSRASRSIRFLSGAVVCDGFLGAYWRRPHAYLDAGVRSAISTFAQSSPMWTLVLPASAAILRAERGNVAMGLYCISRPMTSATVS